MKSMIAFSTRILFFVFIGVVFLWSASLTLELLRMVLPGDELTPIFGLSLFDFGSVCWMLVFIFLASGLPQRAISFILMIADLLGVALMVFADLLLSGQQFTAVPDGLGKIVVYAIGAWTLINLVAIYFFHITEPAVNSEIELRTEVDKLHTEALNQARERFSSKAVSIGSRLADRLESQVLYDLRLLGDGEEQVIDSHFTESAPLVSTSSSKSAHTGLHFPFMKRKPKESSLESVLARLEKALAGDEQLRTYASETSAPAPKAEPARKNE